MKKFAIYLPQFHEIPENNEWWGKGFTEWVNVRKAQPLYKGHKQPKIPIDGYYNLLDKKTVTHQTALMHKYGIDGMIYYHYYFNGKKLLEKPAENLLKWTDIDQPFFFCWANHSWIRSWEGKSTVLLDQKYGTEKDWEKHFQYLLQFFNDRRYEKYHNKPLLMVFKPLFEEAQELFSYFDKRCKECGFDGIHIINTCNNMNDYEKLNGQSYNYQASCFLREPAWSNNLYLNFFHKVQRKLHKVIAKKKPIVYSGDKLLSCGIRKLKKDKNIIHGIAFEWDNTPRHKERGYIITPISKRLLDKYIDLICDEEYLFINAWNEWAEGMILEGTEENGYKYLEWIKELGEKYS